MALLAWALVTGALECATYPSNLLVLRRCPSQPAALADSNHGAGHASHGRLPSGAERDYGTAFIMRARSLAALPTPAELAPFSSACAPARSLHALHAHVPHFHKMLASVERTMVRFAPDRPFERCSWWVADDRELFWREFPPSRPHSSSSPPSPLTLPHC